jgi:hypothetical protein
VVINGYTGKIAGKHPLSWIKITVTIFAVILLLIILAAVFGQRH